MISSSVGGILPLDLISVLLGLDVAVAAGQPLAGERAPSPGSSLDAEVEGPSRRLETVGRANPPAEVAPGASAGRTMCGLPSNSSTENGHGRCSGCEPSAVIPSLLPLGGEPCIFRLVVEQPLRSQGVRILIVHDVPCRTGGPELGIVGDDRPRPSRRKMELCRLSSLDDR